MNNSEKSKNWRDWLDIDPEYWTKSTCADVQNCGHCGKAMLNTLGTNAGGAWRHLDCALKIWNSFNTFVSSTQNDFIQASKDGKIPGIDWKYNRPRSERFISKRKPDFNE